MDTSYLRNYYICGIIKGNIHTMEGPEEYKLDDILTNKLINKYSVKAILRYTTHMEFNFICLLFKSHFKYWFRRLNLPRLTEEYFADNFIYSINLAHVKIGSRTTTLENPPYKNQEINCETFQINIMN